VTDAELVCLAVAQVLLRYDDERHWLRAAARHVGQPVSPAAEAKRVQPAGQGGPPPLMEAALRWLAGHTPGSAELLRLMDATPVPCGQSVITAKRSDLYGWAGYGYCPSHSRWYWGAKLLIICTCDGTVTGFGLASPQAVRGTRASPADAPRPARQPPGPPATAIVTGKGLSGEGTEEFFASPGLDLTLIRPRPARTRSPGPSRTGCGSASRPSSGR